MRQGLQFSYTAQTVEELRSKDPSTLTYQEKMILSIAYDIVFILVHILTLRRGLLPLYHPLLFPFLHSYFSLTPSSRKTSPRGLPLPMSPAQAEKSAHHRGTTGEEWSSAAANSVTA